MEDTPRKAERLGWGKGLQQQVGAVDTRRWCDTCRSTTRPPRIIVITSCCQLLQNKVRNKKAVQQRQNRNITNELYSTAFSRRLRDRNLFDFRTRSKKRKPRSMRKQVKHEKKREISDPVSRGCFRCIFNQQSLFCCTVST